MISFGSIFWQSWLQTDITSWRDKSVSTYEGLGRRMTCNAFFDARGKKSLHKEVYERKTFILCL